MTRYRMDTLQIMIRDMHKDCEKISMWNSVDLFDVVFAVIE